MRAGSPKHVLLCIGVVCLVFSFVFFELQTDSNVPKDSTDAPKLRTVQYVDTMFQSETLRHEIAVEQHRLDRLRIRVMDTLTVLSYVNGCKEISDRLINNEFVTNGLRDRSSIAKMHDTWIPEVDVFWIRTTQLSNEK